MGSANKQEEGATYRVGWSGFFPRPQGSPDSDDRFRTLHSLHGLLLYCDLRDATAWGARGAGFPAVVRSLASRVTVNAARLWQITVALARVIADGGRLPQDHYCETGDESACSWHVSSPLASP